MEVELQFLYSGGPPLVVPTRLCDLELHGSRATSIVDTYYDTVELELRQCGCSLRIRQAENAVRPKLTLKGPSRKRTGIKRRYEAEIEIEQLPPQIADITKLLGELRLLGELQRLSGLSVVELAPIGVLRNRRSTHRYAHGLHRLDLTWDELEFPTGPSEIRLEVEAASPHAEPLLEQARDELCDLLGDDLGEPQQGKARELYERLYPGVLAA